MNKLSKKTYYIYGMGVSYFILDRIFVQWLNYFYLPPENSGLNALLTVRLLTLGFVLIRLVDAIADPVVGYLSDHSKSRYGKRSFFMMIGGIPLCLSMVLFFYPITTSQTATFIYFVIVGSIFFVSYTLVGGPYNALVADLTHTKEERINISTVQSVFRLIFSALPMILSGLLIAKFSPVGSKYSVEGFRKMVIIFSIIAAIGIYFCVFFLNETKITRNETKIKGASFRKTIKYIMNREVILYFIGLFLFFTGFNIIQMVLSYFVTLLMPEAYNGGAMVSRLSTLLFIASAVFFPVTSIATKKLGFKKVMIIDLVSIIIGILIMIFFGLKLHSLTNFTSEYNYIIYMVYLAIAIIGAGISGAGFIFPPAMLSEIATKVSNESKVAVEGLLFGIQGFFLKLAFMTKAIISINTIVYKSNLGENGTQSATPSGVILTLLCAIILFVLSVVFYSLKKE
ncbi:MFS transporter [Oceanivirga miroungae]|uniref:Major facilitator superfamily protein n=1 Tax=Oceanivirga miroungae TaxID=1130046 RepID=A0A6I8MBA9_9FUSO|nr:MFS transporter [Oceanivirga miroungae]VWL84765.1 major facilitator superfamily protein [Oceanivirga miroungae]